jgi:hypothetical protein
MSKVNRLLICLIVLLIVHCQLSVVHAQTASSIGFNMNEKSNGIESDIVGVGITYGGGLGAPLISYDLLPHYSGSTSIGFMGTYEHLYTKSIGIGLNLSYSAASYNTNISYPAGVFFPAGSLTDTKKGYYIGIGGRIIYHFKGTKVLDPYIGAITGITLTYLNSNTQTPGNNQTFHSRVLYGGLLIGALAGLRINVSNYVAIRLECNYSGVPDYLGEIGVTYRIFNRF